MSTFPLGRAPLVMLFMLIVAAPMVLFRPHPPASQLDFWVFAQTHYDEYTKRVADFEKLHPGVRVRVSLLLKEVLRDKLSAAFLSETAAPDLAEIEISDIGRFFQGRRSDIGFLDLTRRLNREGWTDKLVRSRLTPWTYRGEIYGIPHDVHPLAMIYREDMFSKLGIDLPKEVETWDDLYRVFERPGVLDSHKNGVRDRYGIMHIVHDPSHYRPLLLQRGIDFFDANDDVMFDSPLAVDTLKRFAGFVRRNHVVFPQPAQWGQDMYGPMKEDRLFCVVGPDWFIGLVKKMCPELAGKWRAMPLPAWDKGGGRTSTWGGTMGGITRLSKNPEMAWELMKFLNFDNDSLVNRYKATGILPPLKSAWSAPIFSAPDPYTGGQPMGRLLVSLAAQVPEVHQGKYFSEAWQLLGPVVYKCTREGAEPEVELKKVAGQIRDIERRDHFKD